MSTRTFGPLPSPPNGIPSKPRPHRQRLALGPLILAILLSSACSGLGQGPATTPPRMGPGTEVASRFPKVTLAHLPTPLEELESLSGALGGPRIFIKRDDSKAPASTAERTIC